MHDMTKGNPAGHLIAYALPLLLGTWFQMGYNAVDSIIVGRFIGKEALAAVGIASPIMNLVILSISGVSIGAGVLMSEFFGAKDFKSLKRQFSTTVLAGGGISLLVMLLGILCTDLIVKAMAVPTEISDITALYLRITFFGAPFTFFYNVLSAALKSVGDSKTPLRFLMITSIFNGGLDLILIGGFGFGIVCSASTTVAAQALSALLAIIYIMRKIPELCPSKDEWIIDKELLKKTISYGGVTALQQSVQPIGKLLIQGQVNLLGVDVIAAFNAVSKVDAFAFVPEQSIAQAITTYVAQNRGAMESRQAGIKNAVNSSITVNTEVSRQSGIQRIKHGFAVGMGLEVCYFILIAAITTLFKVPIMSMFVTGESSANIIAIGAQYLSLMAFFYILPGMTNGVQGFFRGMGQFKITVLGTFIQTSVRVVMTYLLAPSMGIKGIAIGCAIGWSLMLLVQVPICLKELRKNNTKKCIMGLYNKIHS